MTRKLLIMGVVGHSGVFRNPGIHHDSYKRRQQLGSDRG